MDDRTTKREKFVFPSVPTKPRVPSDGEVEALDAMRAIKDRARALKDGLKVLREGPSDDSAGQAREIEGELKRLRGRWDAWERKRQASARERMILLGHEDVED